MTPNRKLDLKTIVLREDAQVLNEIEVTAKKPLFEQKMPSIKKQGGTGQGMGCKTDVYEPQWTLIQVNPKN